MGLISSTVVWDNRYWWRCASGSVDLVDSVCHLKRTNNSFGYGQGSRIYGLVSVCSEGDRVITTYGLLKQSIPHGKSVIARPSFLTEFFLLLFFSLSSSSSYRLDVLRSNSNDYFISFINFFVVVFLFPLDAPILTRRRSTRPVYSFGRLTTSWNRIFWKSSTREQDNWSTLENHISRLCMVSYPQILSFWKNFRRPS